MYKIEFCGLKKETREELKEHLVMNGYSAKWKSYNILMVDEEEISYVETILSDRNINKYNKTYIEDEEE